jgi:DHA1 family tetracycline resistance protein-like MFS transporter
MSEPHHPNPILFDDLRPPVEIPHRRAAVAFIMITLLLDAMSLGLIFPVWPSLIRGFTGTSANAGWWVGLTGTTWALMQFFCQPIVGGLSDRFGRRPIVLGSNIGIGIDYLVMALSPNLWWLLVGRAISGATASSIGTGYAYIADVTPGAKRAAAFGLLGAMTGLGFIMGPGVGGVLGREGSTFVIPYLGWVLHGGPRLPFFIAGGLSLLNAVFGFLVLPESLPKDRREAFRWSKANPLGSLQLLRGHPDLLPMSGVQFLAQFAHYAIMTVFTLYAADQFGWGSDFIGYTLVGVGVCLAIVQAGLTGPVVKWLGERNTVLAALGFGALGFAILGLAPGWRAWLIGIPILALWAMVGASAQALMSRCVTESEQGRLQGANMSLASIAGVFGPISFGGLYAVFTGPLKAWRLPGAPFLAAGATLLLAMLLALWAAGDARRRRTPFG